MNKIPPKSAPTHPRFPNDFGVRTSILLRLLPLPLLCVPVPFHCCSIFNDPVMLPCNHALCRECATQALRQNQRCPQCMVAIPNLRMLQGRNAWISEMVDSLRNCLNEVGASLTQHAPGACCGTMCYAFTAHGTQKRDHATVKLEIRFDLEKYPLTLQYYPHR